MVRLILARHSAPQIDPAVPASQWLLSDEGRRRARLLGDALVGYKPAALYASTEPKAAETAQIAGEVLGLAPAFDDRFREHRRETVGWLTREALEGGVARFFAQPGERVWGSESGDEAFQRFDGGVSLALTAHPGETVAIVAHGTVISLFASRKAGADPMALWRGFGLPGFLVFTRPDLELEEVRAQIETA